MVDRSDACIGCNACVVACQAENNIPVVGKEEVARGREMHWLRVDRYYKGSATIPTFYFQPVPCMHCENAPCELVCPVDATVAQQRRAERYGLQPLRRHALLFQQLSLQSPALQFLSVRRFQHAECASCGYNPDVTVRSRGVMEKCTYCVQRINHARIEAKKENRPIRDGEVVTACARRVRPKQSFSAT